MEQGSAAHSIVAPSVHSETRIPDDVAAIDAAASKLLTNSTDALRNIAAAAESAARMAPSVGDARWLVLEPAIAIMMERYDELWEAAGPLYTAAQAIIGTEEQRQRLSMEDLRSREQAAFQQTGYDKAWDAVSAASDDIVELIGPHMDAPVTTLDGLLLKARVALSLTEYRGCVEADMGSLIADRFKVTFEPFRTTLPAVATPRPKQEPTLHFTGRLPLVDELLAGWAAWAKTDGVGTSDADWERNAEMRDALIDRAAALPALRENIPAKAIAQSWLEYVSAYGQDKPRNSYGIEGGLCIDIHDIVQGKSQNCLGFSLEDQTIDSLMNIFDTADTIGSLCSSVSDAARCFEGSKLLPAGIVAESFAAEAFRLMDACQNEATRRGPLSGDDLELRLRMLARSIIANGDKNETLAFARDVVALVESRS